MAGPTTTQQRITVVGTCPTALDPRRVTIASAEDVPRTRADIIVVHTPDEDHLRTLQRLRSVDAACPVVVVCDAPDTARQQASLTPLLPGDVTFTDDDGLVLSLRAASVRGRARDHARAVTAAANEQLRSLPNLPTVRSLRLLDELLEFSPVGVLVLERSGRVVLANAAAADLLGVPAQTMVGLPLTVVAPSITEAMMETSMTSPSEPEEVALGHRTVEVRHWRTMNTDDAVVVLVDDVTYRREVEEALADAFEREHEAAMHLRELVTMKDALISSLSHELRTPVAITRGLAETLIEHGDKLDTEQHSDFLERIVTNSKRLQRLVVGLLDLDRIKRGLLRPQVEQVDVAATVQEAVAQTNADRRPLEITIGPDVGVMSLDGIWLERTVVNLLTNADRYTPPGSPLELTVQRWGELLRVELHDHGAGIPDDQKEAIFESFHQGATGSSSGVGIGLALVRQLAELHGGSATVHDTPGGGATFVVELREHA